MVRHSGQLLRVALPVLLAALIVSLSGGVASGADHQ